MTTTEKTKIFQKQISERLTDLFYNSLHQTEEIREVLKILEMNVNKYGGDGGRNISIYRVLECINEPETFYYQNDAIEYRFGQNRGSRIYSPRIDIGIAPSFIRSGERKSRCLMNILLPPGSRAYVYDLFERIDIIQNLKEMIRSKSNENYNLIGLSQRDCNLNNSPLYLFGIELENNLDTKHLMGDFLNSLMLSRNPIVLVQNDKLNFALNLVKFIYTIKEKKGIDYTFFSKVDLLSIRQFREIVNNLLRQNNIREIDIIDYE